MKEVLNIANKCRSCAKAKCKTACPLHQDIPLITKLIRNNQLDDAKDILFMHNPFGYVTGYLCNHEKQCAGNCIFGDVDFYEIEKELSIQYFDDLITYPKKLEERPIAIIGGGIAGLTLAHSLLKKGIKPIIYEKKQLGGVIINAIPDFRYDKTLFKRHLHAIEKNIKVIYQEINIDNISELDQYEHLIFTTGSEIENHTLNYPSVLKGIATLEKFNSNALDLKNKKVGVIGLGNTACDVARALKRINNDVSIIYRRDISSSPATSKELNALEKENIKIYECLNPVKFENNILTMQKNKLISIEGSNRKNIIPLDEYQTEEFDYIVEALGSKQNDLLLKKFLQDDFKLIEEARLNKNSRSLTIKHQNQLVSLIGDAYYGPWNIAQAINSALEVVQKYYPTYLFGGSFNPVTKAHTNIINYLSTLGDVIVVPNGNKYNLKELMGYNHRIKMLKLEINKLEYSERVRISDFEKSSLYKGSIETLRYYNHPVMVIGDDCLLTIHTWINSSKLIEENRFLIITRNNTKANLEEYISKQEILSNYRDHFTVIELFDEDIRTLSSSSYRYNKNKDVLSDDVLKYIKNNKLYEV